MENILVIIIVAAAAGYAAWRIRQALKADKGPCSTCTLKKNCKKFGQSKEK